MDQPKRKDIEQYKHKDKTRLNNPQVGMVSEANDPNGKTKRYSYDPHLDPTLVWTGKAEQNEIDVDTVSIHVHERIDPKTIIHQVHKNSINSYAHGYQHSLFEQPFDHRPVRDEVSFYQHKNAWANRLVAGDSLLVMNSLLEKEGMAGQVQMVYIDPPYGIKYGSNFQPYTNQTQVPDGKDDSLSSEPEMIKAFRDTWELGIHSYLTYLRDRLLTARELLSDTGSCFVQISDENLHHVRELMDEIFGVDNYINQIIYVKTGGLSSTHLASRADYIVWYAKDKKQVKYRQLYRDKAVEDGSAKTYNWVELPDGTRRSLKKEEKNNPSLLPKGSRIYKPSNVSSQGNPKFEFTWQGVSYTTGWKTNYAGVQKLAEANRLHVAKNSLQYVRYIDDFPVSEINELWEDTATGNFTDDKIYVVQSGTKAIARCILMTTDPGDLVLDPTCGSGTTAYAAEMWGRRWITIDTSRIAVQLAKQRIMTAGYEWYKLAHENEGVAGGFVYRTVPHITLASIARGENAAAETLYDQPIVDKSIVRVSGPFTVEAIPAITVKPLEQVSDAESADNSLSRTGETARQDDWRSELLKTGVRTKGGDKIELDRKSVV